MRSPWQIISDLANRRRQRLAEQGTDPTADERPGQLLLPAPSERPEEVARNGNTESQPGHPLGEALREETPLGTEASPVDPVSDGQEDDRTKSAASETSGVTQNAIAPNTKKRAAKPASRRKPNVTQASDSIQEQVAVERSFHDDLRLVDDDIKRLRAELAAKLRTQNEQLKKMLERFDWH